MCREMMGRFVYIVFCILFILNVCFGLRFQMTGDEVQCFTESYETGTRVLGECIVTAGKTGDMEIDLEIKDSKGQIIVSKKNVDHTKFEFVSNVKDLDPHNDPKARQYTAYEYDIYDEDEDLWVPPKYQICVSSKRVPGSDARQKRRVTLNLHSGAAARDYGQLAKEEHLDELEVALRGMYDELTNLMSELAYVRDREDALRGINEATNRRVLWYSAISCVIMVGVGGYQMVYMRNFFRKKKLHLF
uniref:GOLD domain-containing protein n=1 Tax=Timspurckia oligopyrenoides TaxID=708627 RepID=A0A7S1ERJ8_9RHOD|mmetsp:Transcript_1861/g.3317  ORF Transcript_1861/g.3317 Transcript_1861/m.3317 type:complete len:246 (+) Transcript_1861:64-801(+)